MRKHYTIIFKRLAEVCFLSSVIPSTQYSLIWANACFMSLIEMNNKVFMCECQFSLWSQFQEKVFFNDYVLPKT